MSPESRDDITRLLHDWSRGDATALPRLVEAVYPELRRIAARQFSSERPGHTLQPTAIVNEAYVVLDFGIAALLTVDGDAAMGATRAGHHSFTPDYASPEQLRGGRVTTASDVYSLGSCCTCG